MIDKLLKIAVAEIGTRENSPGSNKVKYWNEIFPSLSGSAWCVCFAVWALRKLGFGKTDAPDIFGITSLLTWAKKQNRYVSRDDVKPGDIVGFDLDGNSCSLDDRHAAILERVVGDTLYTIDGNVSDCVKRCSRPRSQCIGGYRPDYAKLAPAQPLTGSTYTVQPGDTLGDIAVKVYGKGKSGRWRDIAAANPFLTAPNYIVRPGMVLTIPK